MEETTMKHLSLKWLNMLLLTVLIAALPVVVNAALRPGYAIGHVSLELDGVPVGMLASSEGGMPYADVVPLQTGASFSQQKRLGNVKYSDITITFGGGMANPLYQWMQETLANKSSVRSGALIYSDQNYNEVKRLVFSNALISEIGFPAFDSTQGKAAFIFTLKLSPESTRPEQGKAGKSVQPPAQQKQLIPSNFRLNLPGIDTQWVTKVEALVVKSKIVIDQIGEKRITTKLAGPLEMPDVVIEMADGKAQSLGDWFNDFLVKGNNGSAREKSATIELLDPTLKTVLLTVNLNKLGIFKLEPSKFESNSDKNRVVRASIYCQGLQFNFSGK